ncbi:MAG: cation:dicarboxylase symporter family transporter, partial [Firmicutes bacterium]|nr:cation:dicarboxylase symporter family transporter [Bacillota bacterium]
MKKLFSSLPFRLLLAVVIGIIVGIYCRGDVLFGKEIMQISVTLKYVLGQLITFCVPLIIIAFIAPSITKLGNNASRLLGIAVAIAYISSIGAAFFSMFAGYGLIPHLNIVTDVEGLRELPAAVFQLDIPQIMPVMSALVFSILIGLAASWTKAKTITAVLDEFQKIILAVVTKVVIPLLPFFIGFSFVGLAYEGTITVQFPVFLKVILIVMIGHYMWLALLYFLGGAYSKHSPLEVVKYYGPAYLTAVGTMSSAATLAVALECDGKSK